MAIRIALAGNPNTGKTTLFNALTGANQTVGNWPGVTVEKKEGKLKGHEGVIITDLPGIYSLSPYTLEEVVARNYLLNEKPDAILNIVDGTNLERNLYLTTQLAELGIPMVIAINMIDVVNKSGNILNLKKMSEELGCSVVEISALKGSGVSKAANTVVSVAHARSSTTSIYHFSEEVEKSLSGIIDVLKGKVNNAQLRWYAIKLFQRDDKVLATLSLSDAQMARIEASIVHVENIEDDEAESIITCERYTYISSIIDSCYTKRNKTYVSLSDKIDSVVTNRFLGLPIFAAVMFFVYYISITTIGAYMTGWVNDVLFVEIIPPAVENLLTSLGTSAWLMDLILNGMIAGVGAVLGFLPQMLVLFFFLAFLEGCGYMARIAFVMDRVFRKFGLSGKSFIPILIGTGCGIPGVMASRTIESEHDRRMTIITTTFIPCSAKLPIIALIAGALFNGAWWVAPSSYFVGITAIIISGIILKKTKLFAGDPTPFVIELPAYHMPTPTSIWRSMLERATGFVQKAGTVILLSTITIWFLSSFNFANGSLNYITTENMDISFLSGIGQLFAWIFAPLGWGQWRAAVAAITGLIAKENVVGTFGVLYGFGEVSENGEEIWSTLQASMPQLAAYSFLVFNLLCAPCFAAIGVIRTEMHDAKWFWRAIAYQTIFAYIVSLIIYQIGTLLTGGNFGISTAIAFVCIAILVYALIRPTYHTSLTTKVKKLA